MPESDHGSIERRRITELFVKGTKEHDRKAMEEFAAAAVDELIPFVARRCDRAGYSRGFAEIVACMTVTKAIAKRELFDCSKPVVGWLIGIARNEIIELYRVKRRVDRRERSLDSRPGDVSERDDKLNIRRGRVRLTPLDELIRREEEDRRKKQENLISEAILNLPEIKRKVMIAYRAGKPPREIAKDVGIPPAAVSKIIFYVIRDLRRRLG